VRALRVPGRRAGPGRSCSTTGRFLLGRRSSCGRPSLGPCRTWS